MIRLNLLQNQLAGGKHTVVYDSLSFLYLQDLLSPEENALRLQVREFADKEITPTINDYVETASFPQPIVDKMKSLNLMHKLLGAPYGKEISSIGKGLIFSEIARVDAGLSTFFAVQWALCAHTIQALGSEQQKAKYLPKLRDFDIIGGWGLTEKENGSDASGMTTSAKKVQGGYLLNGGKRWIGNGNRDIVVIWARDTNTHKVGAYIVENQWKGIKSEPIKHKLGMRVIQNCDITLTDCFVPDENKLPKAVDFSSTNEILLHSRCYIPWIAVGICQGVYDNVVKYITQRHQFQVPLAAFQLQQEKLVRIINNTQAVFLTAWRITKLMDEGKATVGMISSSKAYVSERAREVARLGREMMGGNGIITDYYCIKAVNDAEVVYTYEGTYDINCLVAGRELTGVSAFKVPVPKK